MNEPQAVESAQRLKHLAAQLDAFTQDDMVLLADVAPATLETWRKRGIGPTPVRVGRRYYYPRARVAEWLATRERPTRKPKSVREML